MTAIVRIEDTPLFMGWATFKSPPYIKINPSMVALMKFGDIRIRSNAIVIYRYGGGEEQVPIGDTIRLWP